MGKGQHSKDKLYLTATEWKDEWGGAKDKESRQVFRCLPFYCCGISFVPFEDPVCTEEGTIFDIINIIPYIQKYGKHPVTGAPLKVKDLIKLNFYKNADGEYHCPVLNKVFTEFTHIVAVRTTGNVYCYQAIQELNIKTKNWKDLLTDEPFTRKDIITLQDPNNLAARAITKFDHVAKELKVDKDAEAAEGSVQMSEDARRVLAELGTDKAKAAFAQGGGGKAAQAERVLAAKKLLEAELAKEKEAQGGSGKQSKAADKEGVPSATNPLAGRSIVDAAMAAVSGTTLERAKGSDGAKRLAAKMAEDRTPVNTKTVKSKFSTGAVTCGFTSTTFAPTTVTQHADVQVEKTPTKKGYVRMHTTKGDLNLELHCDIVPRACENFLGLCARGYYDNVIFHRNIKNFMIQGGDPTGTGRGGESIWGKPFKDELTSKLTHSGRGVLSMANSGPHTNGSQFFILYKSAVHLDYKHTVFGKVVGGLDVLAALEKVPVDNADRPKEDIRITGVTIFVDPYTEEEEEPAGDARGDVEGQTAGDEEERGQWYSNPAQAHGLTAAHSGIGKYITPSVVAGAKKSEGDGGKQAAAAPSLSAPPPKKPKIEGTGGFGNFSNW
eukprot:jgi/Mesvir1/21371/Mv20855-RA.1